MSTIFINGEKVEGCDIIHPRVFVVFYPLSFIQLFILFAVVRLEREALMKHPEKFIIVCIVGIQ